MLKRIDLERDYQKHKEEYLEAIKAVCEETAFSGGKFADKFDQEFARFCGVPYAAGVNNGTSALHCAMMALGIGRGDEVIVPALTMSSTNICVLQANAIPVFADVDPQTFTLSVESVKEKITERTKAVIPVSLYGLSADIDPIMALAEEHGLTVIEDDAQCVLGYSKNS